MGTRAYSTLIIALMNHRIVRNVFIMVKWVINWSHRKIPELSGCNSRVKGAREV